MNHPTDTEVDDEDNYQGHNVEMTVAPFGAPPALEDFAALTDAIAVEIVGTAALRTVGAFRDLIGVE
jgi:hypothetical protein